ncbi:hypothetical protein [Photobacterium leiognathi]|uniref:hypothetical protein n=1 Tax=Photobacterium leiognathi TaxID=553611 RepID=UPI002981A06B|nr:hypothetical protein [Photobacterium leiognathi]
MSNLQFTSLAELSEMLTKNLKAIEKTVNTKEILLSGVKASIAELSCLVATNTNTRALHLRMDIDSSGVRVASGVLELNEYVKEYDFNKNIPLDSVDAMFELQALIKLVNRNIAKAKQIVEAEAKG